MSHTDSELGWFDWLGVWALLIQYFGHLAYLSYMASDIFSCVNQARLLPGIPNELRWQGSGSHWSRLRNSKGQYYCWIVCLIGGWALLVQYYGHLAYFSNMALDIFSCKNQVRLGIPSELCWQGYVPHWFRIRLVWLIGCLGTFDSVFWPSCILILHGLRHF